MGAAMQFKQKDTLWNFETSSLSLENYSAAKYKKKQQQQKLYKIWKTTFIKKIEK